ncbi:MAG: Gfo/Idh/MocA family oxidoreductase [Pirellulaceae bacterium]|jgi:predicted dehydrogenase|nr:Gfo/Idh/MocA family oxidoreductase [Pirellulaceae bacterium]MDP7020173.1 Gfo/Idh/MocA family oxidoreductase [Pirellulaceae bacterium]
MPTANRRQFLHQAGAVTAGAAAAAAFIAPAKAADKRIKIGQIGTRHAHAGGKMQTMRKFADLYEVVGVVEPDAQRRKAMEQTPTYRGVPFVTQEQLLNTPGLQAVAVETEVKQLLDTAQVCAQANLHIHLDKPAGESLTKFRALLKETERRQRVVQMGYMYRYNPAFQFLFAAVRDGWLGDVFEVHTVMSKKVNRATREKLAEYPGGSMFELGCHVIDAVVSVLGKPDKVTAHTRRTHPDWDNLADNQLAVFDYPRATATVRSAVIEVDGGRRRQFVVCGQRGTIDIKPLEPPALTLTLESPRGDFAKGTHDVKLPKLGGRYDGDFLDLARIIRGEKESDFPPAHDLAVQEAVLTASGVDLN